MGRNSGVGNTVPCFRVINNGKEAVRVKAKFGRGSANTIEVLDGLNVGETIILSDMSYYANVDRIQIECGVMPG